MDIRFFSPRQALLAVCLVDRRCQTRCCAGVLGSGIAGRLNVSSTRVMLSRLRGAGISHFGLHKRLFPPYRPHQPVRYRRPATFLQAHSERGLQSLPERRGEADELRRRSVRFSDKVRSGIGKLNGHAMQSNDRPGSSYQVSNAASCSFVSDLSTISSTRFKNSRTETTEYTHHAT